MDNGSNQRICKKCLLKDVSPEEYQEKIHKYIEALGKDAGVDSREYERRLGICRNCDMLNAGTCNACGCYVEIRSATKVGKCPKKKW